MRLSPEQQAIIRRCVLEYFGAQARVWLFGSRVRDDASGGDVDLLVEAPARCALGDQLRLKVQLEQALGLPVDLISVQPGTEPPPIARIAQLTGVLLHE